MSEHLYVESGLCNKVHCDQERIVDIYVSAESLKVYENPWVEDTSPNTPEPVSQQPVYGVSEKAGWRNRTDVCLGAVCLLLLAAILALICLGIQMKNDKTMWETKTKQLLANNTVLSNERAALRRMLCAEINSRGGEVITSFVTMLLPKEGIPEDVIKFWINLNIPDSERNWEWVDETQLTTEQYQHVTHLLHQPNEIKCDVIEKPQDEDTDQ